MKAKIILFFLILTVSCFAAECKIIWDANDPKEQVSKYLVLVEDFSGKISISGETPQTTYTIPFVPRGVLLIITVVAVNSVSTSQPAIIHHTYKYKFRLTDEKSNDMKLWEAFGTPEEVEMETPSKFYRTKIEPIP